MAEFDPKHLTSGELFGDIIRDLAFYSNSANAEKWKISQRMGPHRSQKMTVSQRSHHSGLKLRPGMKMQLASGP